MTPEQFRRVEELFHQARAQPAGERDAFVQAACRGDALIFDEVRALLGMANLESALDSLRHRVYADIPPSVIGAPGPATASQSEIRRGGTPGPSNRPGGAGMRIADFTIVRELGRGGMGVIYEAVQEKLNRRVALKVLPTGIGGASADSISRFRREATAAAKLHHTHIVPIYDFGQSGQTYYYAMELVDGHPLTEMVRRFSAVDAVAASETVLAEILSRRGEQMPQTDPGSSDIRRSGGGSSSSGSSSSGSGSRHRSYFRYVARWMADAADALHYAHTQGIIHRDIKPGNLMLCGDGRIMVLDFGLARMTNEMSATTTGALLGTLRYMSPEQAMAKRMKVDHRTDIYSLGATMYELLTFQAAFKGADEKETLGMIITRDPTPPRKIIPHVPRELETICLKTLEKDPGARYATARDLADDLRRFSQDLPIMARTTGPVGRALKFVRRRRAVTIAVCSIVLLGVTSIIAAMSIAKSRKTDRVVLNQRIDDHMKTGKNHYNNGEWESAAKEYQEVLRLDANNSAALVNLAGVKRYLYGDKMSEQQFGECDDLLRRALRVNPKDFNAWNAKGVFARLRERFDEAIEAHTRCNEINDCDYPNWTSLANAYALNHNLEKAEECLLTAVGLKGADSFNMPWYNLAAVHHQLGRPAALDAIEKALTIKGGDPAAMLLKARILLDRPEKTVRKQGLNVAIAADELCGNCPQNARVARILALAHLRNEHWSEAIEAAKRAEKLGDLTVWPFTMMAVIEAHLGHKDLASSFLAMARNAERTEFKEGDRIVDPMGGFLWFESRGELESLRAEVERSLISEPKGGQTKD